MTINTEDLQQGAHHWYDSVVRSPDLHPTAVQLLKTRKYAIEGAMASELDI